MTAHQQPNPEDSSSIAGSVLPLQRAQELITSLTDVVSARITATSSGSVDAIHVLVTGATPAKQVVRNIESALMAQLGLRVDHRKISVATTSQRPVPAEGVVAPEVAAAAAGAAAAALAAAAAAAAALRSSRPVYFEDVEVRGSRARGVTCKVTLRVGAERYTGEADELMQSDKSRVDVASRAALLALAKMGSAAGLFSLEGAKQISAFEREFVFAVVSARSGRDQVLLTGSCELRDSAETAAVLAVLDATNRWMGTQSAAEVVVEDRRTER